MLAMLILTNSSAAAKENVTGYLAGDRVIASAEITPFELVSTAYQGGFLRQGIDSFGRFETKVIQGQITAKDLIQAAISAQQLPVSKRLDPKYLKAVQFQLDLVIAEQY